MSLVYIVQDQKTRDQTTGELVSRFNFGDAARFGELRFLLGPGANPFTPNESVIRELATKLAKFTTEDYLLLTGNPCIIGWATFFAATITEGELKMLQWHGKERKYMVISANLLADCTEGTEEA